MEKQIKLFLEFLENDKKLSSNTLQSYKRDITQYQEYIDKNGLNYLKIDNELLLSDKPFWGQTKLGLSPFGGVSPYDKWNIKIP